MITTNENNVWLIPSFSRNAVSTYRLQELVKDNFEINVRVKMDWKKINEYKFNNTGIVCLNGLHFGIICKVTDEGHTSYQEKLGHIIMVSKYKMFVVLK